MECSVLEQHNQDHWERWFQMSFNRKIHVKKAIEIIWDPLPRTDPFLKKTCTLLVWCSNIIEFYVLNVCCLTWFLFWSIIHLKQDLYLHYTVKKLHLCKSFLIACNYMAGSKMRGSLYYVKLGFSCLADLLLNCHIHANAHINNKT